MELKYHGIEVLMRDLFSKKNCDYKLKKLNINIKKL